MKCAESGRVRFSSWRRHFLRTAGLLALGGGGWLAVYAWDSGFTKKWRRLIAKELAKHGLRAEITRLTIDPVDGLTAREVRLFDTSHQDQQMATIDRISLQIDVGSLMNGEPFLRTVQLRQANISLPVDPADAASEWLVVQGFNARLVFEDEQIEIAQAEGVISGIRVQLNGAVKKKRSQPESKAEEQRKKQERRRRLQEMRDRRGVLRSVLRIMERFTLPEMEPHGLLLRHKAELILETDGDFSKPETLEIRAAFTAGPLVNGTLRLAGTEAEAELSAGQAVLKSLRIRDSHGALHAAGVWNLQNPAAGLDFTVDSRMDLTALLGAVLGEVPPWLRTITFQSPPQLQAQGVWLTKTAKSKPDRSPSEDTEEAEESVEAAANESISADGDAAIPPETNGAPAPEQETEPPPLSFFLMHPPLRATGRVEAGPFHSRGVAFRGFKADFSVQDNGLLYLRNGALIHSAGAIRGQAMRNAEGIRYEVDSTLPPHTLLPLFPLENVRKILERFVFSDVSKVRVKISGGRRAGPDASWRHTGGASLEAFHYNNIAVRGVSLSVRVDASEDPPLRFADVHIAMPEGEAAAKEVRIDPAKRLLWIEDGKAGVQPAAFVSLFFPPLAAALEKYRFSLPPQVQLAGVIDLTAALLRNDLHIRLQAPGDAGLDIVKQPWSFSGVSGSLHLLGGTLDLKLAGETMPGAVAGTVLRLDRACSATFEGVFSLIKNSGVSPRYQVLMQSPETCGLLLLGRVFPVSNLKARLECAENRLKIIGAGLLFNGRLGASLEFPRADHPGHSGAVVLERSSFPRLMALFDTTRNTEGLLSGAFDYQMETGEPKSLRGAGTAKLVDGDIFALPLLGPLSALVDALLPGEKLAYSIAREATGKYEVAGGKVTATDIEAVTRTFRLSASGSVDYVHDRVEMLARVNLRGAPGMILYPVSKLFEYEATGVMKNPVWKPRFLQNPFARQPVPSDAPPARDPAPVSKKR